MNLDRQLNDAIGSAFPAQTTSSELRDKVMSLRPRRRRKPGWYAFAATCAAASGVAAVLIFAPSSALAGEVLRQVDAIQGHLTTYKISNDGRREKIGEGWMQGGKIREKMDDGVPFELLIDPDHGIDVSW
jgi:hypothetical protein